MSVEIVIICGALIGFIASKVRGSGFGLWWDVYLGIAGAAFASCIMISGYFMNVFPMRDVMGMNLYSIGIDITGALALIYAARFYHGAIHFSNWGKSKVIFKKISLDKQLRHRHKLAPA